MATVEEIKSQLLSLKRALALDLADNEIPTADHASAHYWNAVAHIELAINSLTLSQKDT